jgi:hypothetical protein
MSQAAISQERQKELNTGKVDAISSEAISMQ